MTVIVMATIIFRFPKCMIGKATRLVYMFTIGFSVVQLTAKKKLVCQHATTYIYHKQSFIFEILAETTF